VETLYTAEPIRSALAGAYERLRETPENPMDHQNSLDAYSKQIFYESTELDLTIPINHGPFVIKALNILQKTVKDSFCSKTKIIGILRLRYIEGKKTFFKWNENYDVISILIRFRIIFYQYKDKKGEEVFTIYHNKVQQIT
jgi:hypothetical protein